MTALRNIITVCTLCLRRTPWYKYIYTLCWLACHLEFKPVGASGRMGIKDDHGSSNWPTVSGVGLSIVSLKFKMLHSPDTKHILLPNRLTGEKAIYGRNGVVVLGWGVGLWAVWVAAKRGRVWAVRFCHRIDDLRWGWGWGGGGAGSRPDFPDLTSFYLMFIPGFEGHLNDVACLHVQLPKLLGILHANSSCNNI